MPSRVTNVDHLECSACGRTYEVALRNVCPECARPLLARYDLEGLRREDLLPRKDLWRYLPVPPLGRLQAGPPAGGGGGRPRPGGPPARGGGGGGGGAPRRHPPAPPPRRSSARLPRIRRDCSSSRGRSRTL